MKNLLLFLCLINFVSTAFSQDWIPKGLGLLPAGYTVYSISNPGNGVIWATASAHEVVNSGLPVPLSHNMIVYRSIDDGNTWEVLSPVTGKFSWDIVGVDADTAWITTQTYGNGLANTIYKTEDGGQTWEEKLSHTAAGVFLRKFDETHLFAQVNEFVAYSGDNGETWAFDTIFAYLGSEFNTLTSGNNMVDFKADTLWVGTTLGRVIRFTEYGENYKIIFPGTVHTIQSVAFANHLEGMMMYYNNSTGNFGLVRTMDGGDTWEFTPTKPSTLKEYNITYVPGTQRTFVAATNYFGVGAEYFYSTDMGQTWTLGGNISGAQINAIQFSDPNNGWVASSNAAFGNEVLVYKWNSGLFTSLKEDPSNQLPFELLANPVTSILSYTFNGLSGNHHQVITDLSGRICYDANSAHQTIDVSTLPTGPYFLKIEMDGKSGVKQFIRQ